MTLALLIALGCVLLAGAAFLVVLARRRRRDVAPAAQTAAAPARELSVDALTPADLGRSRAPRMHSTGGTSDDENRGIPSSPGTGVSFKDLTRASAGADRPRFDPRELLAAGQKARIVPSSVKPWRRTSRAFVHDSRDGDDVLIFERTVERGPAEAAFARLVSRKEQVSAGLSGAWGQVDSAWPREPLLAYNGGVQGYFMPALDEAYVLEAPGHGRAVRTLEAANGLLDVAVQPLDDDERLELVRALASWLRAVHAAGVVFGDLGLRSLAYATSPLRIRVLDYDTARVAGSAALLDPGAHGERDPRAAPGESSYDSDRFLFAQLAFRLLVTRTNGAEIDPQAVPSGLLGLEERQLSRLRSLWARAVGPRGTRPTMDEWVDALGRRQR